MAHAHGPCARANLCAKLSCSALMMKLMSPCRCSVTFFERCRATAGRPMFSNRRRSDSGSGAAYSTNSKPSVRIGLFIGATISHDFGDCRQQPLRFSLGVVHGESGAQQPAALLEAQKL